MAVVAAAVVVAIAIAWGALLVAREVRAARDEAARARALAVVQLFAPAIAAANADPRSLLVWQPLARAARGLFPAEFASLDQASGSTFPFTAERLQAAHAQWTADWLAWERTHDAEYKRKAAAAGDRLLQESIEREKLDLYQRRYEEYIRVARALQAMTV
jgi:hypothetical protein